jgi:hypothetical protein
MWLETRRLSVLGLSKAIWAASGCVLKEKACSLATLHFSSSSVAPPLLRLSYSTVLLSALSVDHFSPPGEWGKWPDLACGIPGVWPWVQDLGFRTLIWGDTQRRGHRVYAEATYFLSLSLVKSSKWQIRSGETFLLLWL